MTEPRYLNLVTVSSFCLFFLSLCWCHWCRLSSAWSSRHWSPCRRLWRFRRDTQLILPVLLPLLQSHRCHQQSRDWWLFCLRCWQSLRDRLRRLSWSFPEIWWRWWVRVEILSDSNCSSEPVSYAAIEEDGTIGHVIEVLMTHIRLALVFFQSQRTVYVSQS